MARRTKQPEALTQQQEVLLQNLKDSFAMGKEAYNAAVAIFNDSLSKDQNGHARVDYEQLLHSRCFFN